MKANRINRLNKEAETLNELYSELEDFDGRSYERKALQLKHDKLERKLFKEVAGLSEDQYDETCISSIMCLDYEDAKECGE